MPVLVEVNMAGKKAKQALTDEVIDGIYKVQSEGIKIKGLMCIPPVCDSEKAMAYFDAISKLFIDIKDKK